MPDAARARVCYSESALAGGAGGDHGAGRAVPVGDRVLAEALAAWVGDGVRALAGRLDADDGARGVGPAAHAVLLVLQGVCRRARVRDRERPVRGAATAGDGAHAVVPAVDAHVAGLIFRDDDQIAQVAVFDGQVVQAAPVAAGSHQSEAHPGLPLQGRYAVHRAGGLDVAGQRHAAEDVADGAERLLLRLVQEGRHFLDVPRDQQEALARLGQTAQLAAVVSGFRHGVAEAAE